MLSPGSVDKLSTIKSFFATFHDVYNLFVGTVKINVPLGHINLCILKLNYQYSFCIAEDRNIGIMCRKDNSIYH